MKGLVTTGAIVVVTAIVIVAIVKVRSNDTHTEVPMMD